jgi:hypothetical protein
MAKTPVTFRLDSEIVKRLKDAAARSGGKISQAEIVESALADRFAVRDGTKLLAKVNQDQSTALTLVKEQSTALAEFQQKVSSGINVYSKRLHDDVEHLDQTVRSEMRSAVASLTTLQTQMSGMIGTLRQIENSVQENAKARLEAWQLVTLGILTGFAILGAASVVWWLMRWSGRI